MIEKCNRPAAILDKMPAHGFIWDIQRVCRLAQGAYWVSEGGG